MTSKTILSKLALFCLGAVLIGTSACQDDEDPILETKVKVYASSNTTGNVGIVNVTAPAAITSTSFIGAGMDADGIYHDSETDMLYQVNRSDNTVKAYKDVSLLGEGSVAVPSITTQADFINGRELTVSGDKLVVAQDASADNGDVNKFFVYNIGVNSLTLANTFIADINLWGIQLEGNTMYAIEDNSNRIAIYENFLANTDGIIMPTRSIMIEGMARTHGLTYDAAADMMILTDVAEATIGDDGAITVISGFSAKSATDGATISLADQIIIEGAATKLGNPVDVAYDSENSRIYVAERKNSGGLLLGWDMPTTSGDIAPAFEQVFDGASAVHISVTQE